MVVFPDDSDKELLILFKNGDIKSLGGIYERYAPKIYRYTRKYLNIHQDAEDVVEETFEHIIKGIQSFNTDKGSASQWIFTIAHNLIVSRLRQQGRQEAEPLPDILPILDSNSDPWLALENEVLRRALECAWSSISEADRAMLLTPRQGRRGPRPKAWREALERLRSALNACLQTATLT